MITNIHISKSDKEIIYRGAYDVLLSQQKTFIPTHNNPQTCNVPLVSFFVKFSFEALSLRTSFQL